MSKNLQKALSEALTIEFNWVNDFENPHEEYQFSKSFESNMKGICKKAEYSYVTVGSKRIRKSLLAILVALFVLAATGCAVAAKYIVTWNETQNYKQGTLDVTFDIEGPATNGEFIYLTPAAPTNFDAETITKEDSFYVIHFLSSNQDSEILYCQQTMDESMSLSIDNEDAYFEEISINGYKGYESSKDNINAVCWADGLYYYELQGTCEISILKEMAESLTTQ
ncbi:MAG: DUF4367 domain-containing protein [Firmicutes bacterium]|nr:DUF4367 domain-containing protein [Bacillota bacterium]